MIVSIIIPLLGVFYPILLGQWCGGYRMANFHFAGNELSSGWFIKKSVIKKGTGTENGRCQCKYFKRRERASRNGSSVVDIFIPPPSFKPVS